MTIDDFSQNFFWDVKKERLDLNKNKSFVIQRIIDRGDWPDVKLLFQYYGKDIIIEVLQKARYLDKKTVNFFATYYDLEKESFRAFQPKQSGFYNWQN